MVLTNYINHKKEEQGGYNPRYVKTNYYEVENKDKELEIKMAKDVGKYNLIAK